VRAVYRDMLTLHDHLLEVEARHATEEELLRVHTPGYLRTVREAVARAADAGVPVPFGNEMVVSGASWDAALAAAGTALVGVDVVMAGEARNAFCAARPPGNMAYADGATGFSLVNNVAVAARHLAEWHGLERVLIVEWGAQAGAGTATIVAEDPAAQFLSVHQQPSLTGATPLQSQYSVALPAGATGGLYLSAFEAAFSQVVATYPPQFILLSSGFDALAADPVGELALQPSDFYPLTRFLREQADRLCGGRLVSVLEGGYAPPATGKAVVQHLRALAGLPAA
jgi:acetoin utilization deacetylase AcuC-like enzyme